MAWMSKITSAEISNFLLIALFLFYMVILHSKSRNLDSMQSLSSVSLDLFYILQLSSMSLLVVLVTYVRDQHPA